MKVEEVLAPRSIAIVGGSLDPATWGGRVTLGLRRLAPSIELGIVNRRGPLSDDLVSVTSIPELPHGFDQVLIAAPAPAVAGLLREAAHAGIGSAVIFSSGFGESSADGAAELEAELRSAIDETGIAVLGPNCLGYNVVLDSGEVLAATSTTVLDVVTVESMPITPAPIAIVTQSGGIGAMTEGHLIEMGCHPVAVVHTGNEYGLSLQAIVGGLASSEAIRTIGVYLEGLRRADDLVELVDACRSGGKHLVAMVGGRSDAGSRAIMSHSGRMVVSGRSTELLATDLGVPLVHDMHEFAVALATSTGRVEPIGTRIGIVTASGGLGTVVADLAADHGFVTPELAVGTQAELAEVMPSFASLRNPVDVTGMLLANPDMMASALTTVSRDENIDAVVVALGAMEAYADTIVAGFEQSIATGATVPVFILWPQGPRRAYDRLRGSGTVVVESAAQLLDVLSARHRLTFARPEIAGSPALEVGVESAAALLRDGIASRRGASEVFAKEVLEALGFSTPRRALVESADAAVDAAAALGGPLVVKGHGARIVHKENLGLVRLGVRGGDAVRDAFGSIEESLSSNAFDVEVLVETQAAIRREFLLGWTRTAVGTVILFGGGGSGAEAIADIATALAPLDRTRASAMLASTVAGRTLIAQGAESVEDVVDALIRVADLAIATADVLVDLDVNPLALTTTGDLVVLDACLSASSALGRDAGEETHESDR